MRAPAPVRDNPLTRSVAGLVGIGVLGLIVLACVLSLPWTLGQVSAPEGMGDSGSSPRYDQQVRTARHLPPTWWGVRAGETGEDTQAARMEATARLRALERLAREQSPEVSVDQIVARGVEPTTEQIRVARPWYAMGTDALGRDMLVRCLAGGGVSLAIGILAAFISVLLGTMYGAISGYVGGRVDAVMMRVVDVLYGLPYVLLVVLLAVAVDAGVDNWQLKRAERSVGERAAMVQRELQSVPEDRRADSAVRQELEMKARQAIGTGELTSAQQQMVQILTLLVAIGGVSWLTMSRVVRGQVLSLKAQPFMEAARAMGTPTRTIFVRHLLPNLVGPITVYATLTVPQAILQESFLSFLGIGVRPPMPSWGNLAADGLSELNPFRSNWWLLVFPCVLLGVTLLALNFVGEGLREALDPKRSRR
ncbi:MAG: ABC transporter permease [Phycisphaerales bacterium]|nr:ABC transporter permease [Phycisphaerales bacterium]